MATARGLPGEGDSETLNPLTQHEFVREKLDYLDRDWTIETMFPGRFQRKRITCQTRPLRVCVSEKKDISQCVREVAVFEATCTRKIQYTLDREGLDENNATCYYGRNEFQQR